MSSQMQIPVQERRGAGVPGEGQGWPRCGGAPGGGGLVPPSISSARQRVGANEGPFVSVSPRRSPA